MCGIAGIYAYRESAPPVDSAELLRIRDHMRRRGPDGEGMWISGDGRIGLAHRRLAIIDGNGRAADGERRRPLSGHIQRRDLQLPRAG